MALWPFRRKSVRKRSRSGTVISDNEPASVCNQDDGRIARTMSKKARTEPTKLQRRRRTYSFSPGRHDSIRFDRGGRLEQTQSGCPVNPQAWERTPTLHPTRRKSSKRRRDDHDREAEIKAMSAFMPARPAADIYKTPSGSKQSTKRAKTGRSTHHHRLPSQVSLPYPDSVGSAMSLDSDPVAYRISALGSLAPRPTLKYAQSTRWSLSRADAPTTAELLKRPLGTRESNPEDLRDSRKRIDELANDLNAKDLRELMERDNRRRERRRQKDQERMEQKLAHSAEYNRRDEAEANETSKTSTALENAARDTASQEPVGLGIERASGALTSEKPEPHAFDSQGQQDGRPWESAPCAAASSQRVECAALHDQFEPSLAKPAETEKNSLPSFSHGSRLVGILRSSKSRSKSTLDSDRDRGATDADSGRKNSVASSRGASRLSLSSLLKWGGRSQRYSGPSSFSNTSREEMQSSTGQTLAQAEALARLQGEDPSNAATYLASKSSLGAPKRTRSRFREDLPELPLSPPDSRVQSPEAEPPLPVLVEKSPELDPRQTPPPQHDTSSSIERPSGAHSAEPHLSMSLASIDSEGSWLSGRMDSLRKPVKRDSLARAKRRETASSSDSATSSTHEELAITDDEYLSRLAPDRRSGFVSLGRRSGEGRPSSDEESVAGEAPRWGRVGAKAEVVQHHNHNRDTMRSQQGFLTIDSGEEDDFDMLAPRHSE